MGDFFKSLGDLLGFGGDSGGTDYGVGDLGGQAFDDAASSAAQTTSAGWGDQYYTPSEMSYEGTPSAGLSMPASDYSYFGGGYDGSGFSGVGSNGMPTQTDDLGVGTASAGGAPSASGAWRAPVSDATPTTVNPPAPGVNQSTPDKQDDYWKKITEIAGLAKAYAPSLVGKMGGALIQNPNAVTPATQANVELQKGVFDKKAALGDSIVNNAASAGTNNFASILNRQATGRDQTAAALGRQGYHAGDAMYDSAMRDFDLGTSTALAQGYGAGQTAVNSGMKEAASLYDPTGLSGAYGTLATEQGSTVNNQNKQKADTVAGLTGILSADPAPTDQQTPVKKQSGGAIYS